MTMTDYGLMTVSAAAILIIASYWWRRAPEAARIFVTEIGWWGGSFFAAVYVWIELTSSRPLRVWLIGLIGLTAIWLGVLLPLVNRRVRPARRPRRGAARMSPGTEGRPMRWRRAPGPPGIRDTA